MGSRDPCEYWGRWHSFGKIYLICIIAQVLENYSDTSLLGFCVKGRQCESVTAEKRKPVIRSLAHNPLLLQLPILLHSMALADIHGIKTEFNKFCCGCLLHSAETKLATSTVLLVSAILCMFTCWMVPIGMRHHGDQVCLLFLLWSGHCIQVAFTIKPIIQIYMFLARLILQLDIQKSLLKSPSGGGE